MKFTLSWLKDHLETEASLDEIVEALTMIGLEVEEVDSRDQFNPFVIAKVLTAEKHPDADKLQVLSVDTGNWRPGSGCLRRTQCPSRSGRCFRRTRHLCARY